MYTISVLKLRKVVAIISLSISASSFFYGKSLERSIIEESSLEERRINDGIRQEKVNQICEVCCPCCFLMALTVQVTGAASENYTRKIIVFKSKVISETHRTNLLKKYAAVPIKDLKIINATVANVPAKAVRQLQSEDEILRVEDDARVYISKKPAPSRPPQVIPWGIDWIDAELAKAITTGKDVKVAVLDTGIDVNHPDFKTNIKGGYNAINPRKSYTDDNGHGTHVAGIIAAMDNDIGVAGVGPDIYLYSVKVLNRNGSGYVSDVIEGIEWSVNNGMQVINMSLGTSSDIQSFDDAVKTAYENGFVIVAAAGNEGSVVSYPALMMKLLLYQRLTAMICVPGGLILVQKSILLLQA